MDIMKTTMKTNILAAILFVATISYANTDNTIFTNVKKVKVEFSSVKKGNTVEIKDETGVIIYFERIQNTGDFSRIFDLTALDDGNYAVELNKDFEIIIKPFAVNTGEVTFISEKEEVVFKPVIRTTENKLLISKYAFEKHQMDIKIYFEGTLIFTENLKGEKSLNRIYQLSADKKGAYNVVVNTNKKTYQENFNL